jgi:N-methylhydantoinase A
LAGFELGVDIGGTFTDLVLITSGGSAGSEAGVLATHKILTTQDDPARAVLAGIRELLAQTEVQPGQLDRIVHATTLITNATIERRGAVTGMLVTEGFKDVLDIGREHRYDLTNLKIDFPAPLVPRPARCQVSERITGLGTVEIPLRDEDVLEAVDGLVRDQGIQALAICFLHSFQNGDHEVRAGQLVARAHPGLYVTLSHEVAPFSNELERWTTATINAHTQPLVDAYVDRLEGAFRDLGFRGSFAIMTSSGGIATIDVARRFPVRLIESGPAAGVLAATYLSRDLSETGDVLALDMGGTTTKGGFVVGGKPLKESQIEVARCSAFQKGSGLTARVPAIDLIEIGSGGGAIAQLDQRQLIRVGPESASADPGPACYGQGGERPTLTDANLLLGYLGADSFLGGTMALSTGAAAEAIRRHIAEPLGIEPDRAALGIHDTVNEDIARALRVHAAELGLDYRRFPIVATGGSAPIHAVNVARKIRAPRVIFPLGAGIMSAFGLLVSPLSHEIQRSQLRRLDRMDGDAMRAVFTPLLEEARAYLNTAGLSESITEALYSLDMRYYGQGHEIAVPLPDPFANPDIIAAAEAAFDVKYKEVHGISFLDQTIECVNWKVEVFAQVGPTTRIRFSSLDTTGAGPLKGTRPAYFPPSGWHQDCPVYDRYRVSAGMTIEGPALIEENESTAVLAPGDRAVVDGFGNLVVDIHFGEEETGS